MCAVALRLKIAGHVWKTVKFLDFRIHGESFISRLPLSCDGLLSCSCVLSNPVPCSSQTHGYCVSVCQFLRTISRKNIDDNTLGARGFSCAVSGFG